MVPEDHRGLPGRRGEQHDRGLAQRAGLLCHHTQVQARLDRLRRVGRERPRWQL